MTARFGLIGIAVLIGHSVSVFVARVLLSVFAERVSSVGFASVPKPRFGLVELAALVFTTRVPD